jgi:aminoglycoside 3-N-acetyltransferase
VPLLPGARKPACRAFARERTISGVTHDTPSDQPGEPKDAGRRALHPRSALAADLGRLGVRAGAVVLVHSSMKALGYVPGGTVAVAQALRDAVGPAGTLVVPTQTGENSDPAGWSRPPVPEAWWPVIRAETPAFDPALTPGRHMGALTEQLRTWPGAVRSDHPTTSFAAVGARAAEVVAVHDLDSQCGERSPLATLERLGARVLLLGAGFAACTGFHLAEYRVPGAARRTAHSGAVRTPDGGREWVTWDDLDVDDEDFERIGAAFLVTGAVASGPVGAAIGHLFDLAEGVAFATRWMSENRDLAAP